MAHGRRQLAAMTTFLVLDTNSLPIEGNLDSGFWTAVFRLCSMKAITPAISEVTLHEAVNLRRDTANGVLEAFVAAHTRLSRMTTVAPVYTPTGDDIAAAHSARLSSVLAILPLDGDHAREAFRREALRVVPARLGRGGRDSAIWLTVAKLANDGHEVHFVTKNRKDFGAGGLFVELLDEIRGASHPVQYYASTNDFIDTIATKVAAPVIKADNVSNAFGLSIRSRLISLLETVESAEHTVDRAWNADISANNIRLGQAYEIDGQGLVHVKADVVLADPGHQVQWVRGKIEGWLSFEPGTFAGRPSEIEDFLDVDFR